MTTLSVNPRLLQFPCKKANEVADTNLCQVDTVELMERFRKCSLSELRVIQELLSEVVANRRRYFPQVGERVAFMNGKTLQMGQVIRIGRKMVTVLLAGSRKQLRVPYADIKTAMLN
jgi:ribosome biogenesis protein Nip4